MAKWINGKKSYIGFVGLGLLFVLRGLGLDDNLQSLAGYVGLPETVQVFNTLAAFFGSLASVGITHKLTKAAKT